MPIASGEISSSFRWARCTKRRLSSAWIGLTAVFATNSSSGAATIARIAVAVPIAGATQAGAPVSTATAASREHERRQGERDREQPPRTRGEDERLGLRPAELLHARVREGRPRGKAHDEHQEVRVRRRRDHQRRARGCAEAEPRRVDSRVAPLHPDAQASGLVVLELEQMEHQVEPAGEQDEQPGRGRRQAEGRHGEPSRRALSATSRGCSIRKRRATARNWPGASA